MAKNHEKVRMIIIKDKGLVENEVNNWPGHK